MQTKIIEASNGFNWGKFLVGQFEPHEWAYPSVYGNRSLLSACGWTDAHRWVLDLQTGEGAFFRVSPHAHASRDLGDKHRIWVCPLFEPFLSWLYQQDVTDIATLPAQVTIPDAPPAFHGYRRSGGLDHP